MSKLLLFYLVAVLTTFSQTQPTITLQPEDVTTTEGKYVSFKCEFGGPSHSNKAYQWWKNPGAIKLVDGESIRGATTERLALINVDITDDSTTYTCECIDLSTYPADSSWINSRSALLRVRRGYPRVSYPPLDASVSEGSTAKFFCGFADVSNKGYQWWKYPGKIQLQDSENVIGSDSSTLTLLNVSSSDNGISYSCELRNMNFFPSDNSWIMSDTVSLNVMETSWNKVESVTNHSLNQIIFSDSLNGFAWGNKAIISTNDGGNNWNEIEFADSLNFSTVQFVDEDIGWGVAKLDHAHLVKTTNGGKDWQMLSGYPQTESIKISFIDYMNGWILGYKEIGHYLSKTNDGGLSWEDLPEIEYENSTYGPVDFTNLSNFFFISDSVGFVNYYYSSRLEDRLKTIDCGQTWFYDGGSRKKVSYVNDSTGWALGYDSESAWSGYPFNDFAYRFPNMDNYYNRYYHLSDVIGKDTSSAWIIGEEHSYYREYNEYGKFIEATSNGGKDWNSEHFDMDLETKYRKMYKMDNKTIWVVGDEGIMLKYKIPNDPVSVENNKTSIPQKIKLHQNYPNPFNPTTTIKYSIPNVTSSFSLRNVTLKVYDVLGKEVMTLVNQHQKSGNYEVKFDSDGFSSGIYFYTLKVDEFLDTKKMIFLK